MTAKWQIGTFAGRYDIIPPGLDHAASRVQQVIRGEFRADRDRTSAQPLVRVVAFDGAWFEVRCDDDGVLGRVRAAFKDPEPISPPLP